MNEPESPGTCGTCGKMPIFDLLTSTIALAVYLKALLHVFELIRLYISARRVKF